MNAYIIDDEEVICMLLAAILRREGIVSKHSTTLSDALEEAVNFQPDVIFLDLNLSDGSGFSIVPKLHEKIPEAEIIIISAYNGKSEVEQAKNLNIKYFLPKPLNRDLILSSLREIA